MPKEKIDTSQLKLRHAMFFPKLGLMALTFFILGILPLFPAFRHWGDIPNRIPMLWVIGVTWIIYVIYESWFLHKWRRKESTKIVSYFEVATGAIALSFFIHYLGGINGPLFFLYFTHLFEASLALIINLPFIVAGIMTIFIVGEFILFTNQGIIVLNAAEISLIMLRISILFMVAYWANSLVRSILSERKTKGELAKAIAELQELNLTLEEKVEERTKEARQKTTELEKFYKLIVGRELKMAELKKKIEELEEKLKEK